MSEHESAKPETSQNGKESQSTQGPMSNLFGWIGFGIGVLLMILFVPRFESGIVNFIVGAAIGMVSAVIGSLIGGLLDQR